MTIKSSQNIDKFLNKNERLFKGVALKLQESFKNMIYTCSFNELYKAQGKTNKQTKLQNSNIILS